MLNFGAAKTVDFLPDEEGRAWVAEGLSDLWQRLGDAATAPRLLTQPTDPVEDFDALFSVICGAQGEVGQEDIEFALLELEGKPDIPRGFEPLGIPEGQLMHTFVKGAEFLIVAVPAILRLPELAFASIARELGRIEIHRRGGHQVEAQDIEADAELAGIALGLGVWVANGAYVFENACCGGGCGIDLSTIRAGLSMPEACFAVALDGHRKGLSRRVVARHLQPTQRAALKRSWGFVGKAPELKALASAKAPAALASS